MIFGSKLNAKDRDAKVFTRNVGEIRISLVKEEDYEKRASHELMCNRNKM